MSTTKELIAKYTGDTKGLEAASGRAEKSIKGVGKTTKTASKTVAASFKAMTAAIAPLLTIYAAIQTIKIADQFQLLSARVKNAAESVEEYNQVFGDLQKIAAETGSELSTSVDVFQRLSMVRAEIGATAEEMTQFTANVQKLGVISGASTGALNAGLTQLGQGLGAGILRAEEFNSLVENTPKIVEAIADSFGVTTGALRNLVIEGHVLSEDVFTAILSQTQNINSEFSEFPKTAGRAFQELKINFSVLVGQITEATGVSKIWVGTIEFVNRIIKSISISIKEVSASFSLMGAITKQVGNNIASALGLTKAKDFSGEIKKAGDKIKAIKTETAAWEESLKKTNEPIKEVNENLTVTEDTVTSLKEKYGELVKALKDEGVSDGSKAALKALEKMEDQIVDNKNEMSDFIFDGIQGFGDLRSVALNALSEIGRSILRISMGGTADGGIFGQLAGAISGSLGIGNMSTGGGQIVSSTPFGPGFATGGKFTVGGSGGTDTQNVQFRATPGERVTIETPQQQRTNGGNGGSGTTIVQNLTFSSTSPQEVRAQVFGMLPMIEQQTVSAVKDAQKRGKM